MVPILTINHNKLRFHIRLKVDIFRPAAPSPGGLEAKNGGLKPELLLLNRKKIYFTRPLGLFLKRPCLAGTRILIEY